MVAASILSGQGMAEARVFDFLKRQGPAEVVAVPEVKASAAGGVIAWAGQGARSGGRAMPCR